MLNDALLERALRWLLSRSGEAEVLSARRVFEEDTGAIHEGSADYESRIAHFFEQYLCTPDASGLAPVARFAALSPELSATERAQLAG